MRLGITVLDLTTVNQFRAQPSLRLVSGDPATLYVQLLNESYDCSSFDPQTIRYVPNTGATLSVVLDNIDTSRRITKAATQPFAGDASIWSISLTPSESARLEGTISLKFTLTEGTAVRNGRLAAGILIESA